MLVCELKAFFVLTVERFSSFDEFRPNDVIGGGRSTPLDPKDVHVTRAMLALPNSRLVMQRSFARRLESDMALTEAATIARANLNKDSEMAQIVEDYSKLLKSHGKTEEAALLRAQVKRARAVADLVVRPHPSL